MGRRFAELAFTPLVKQQQIQHGSRHLYERVEQSPDMGDRLGHDEQAFLEDSDGFYMASTTETGWPYIAFADLRGNKQYISVGNLQHDDRVALFFMDYPRQSRLKILGRAKVHEGTDEARRLIEQLRVPGEKSPAERALVIHVEAFDWNCPQHITPLYTEEELTQVLEPIRQRLEALEAENKRLRASAA